MSNRSLSKQITILIILLLALAIVTIYLIRFAGLDLKGIVAVAFMTIIFYTLIKR